ncbi:MAG: hypothetical protein M1840_007557 [Geoglossum simile]|nr:MAG: hypothetical protein M1840_007557 [Geoglossum simile]
MPPVSDLIRDSKLETTFYGNYTQHVYNVSGANPRQRIMRIEECWERRENLGSGAFGTVWLEKLITDNSKEKYRAIKGIKKGMHQSGAIDFSHELEAIAKFSHQKYNACFVKSFGWYENPGYVFIAMEYFPLGDLQNYLSSPLPEKDTQQVTHQVLEGLSFMHDNGFAHRDLKPNNILVQSKGPDWWVKIGDFGISKRAEGDLTALRTFSGTLGFLAPEILAQHGILDDSDFGARKEYTVAVDVWSLGEIAFRALTGKQPFPIRSLREYVRGASLFPVEMLRAHNVSEEGCDFLNILMAPMPEDRLTARNALSHIWIKPQIPSLARVSTEIQRKPITITEEAIPPQEYPTTEASARWSTVDVTTPKSNILVNPAFTEKSLTMLQPVQDTTNTAIYHQQGRYDELVASASNDKTVRLWDSATGAARRTLEGHSGGVMDVAFSPDGKLVASASNDKTVRLWDSATGAARRTLEGHSGGVIGVAFSPDGKLVASASDDSTVRLWDSATGAARRTLEGHSGGVIDVAFSPDGKLVASASFDGTVRLWDSATGAARRTLEGHSGGVIGVAFSPDGKLVASASYDSTVRLWDSATGAVRRTLEGHPGGVIGVAFSPDGKLVASASDDSTVRLWDSATGAVRRTLEGHSGGVIGVAFSPDGKLVASASYDRTVRLWDSATGAARRTLEGHSGGVIGVAFSPDGKLVASASYDGTVRLWDSATGAG